MYLQVAPHRLEQFMEERRRSGYTLVGAEQTSNSVKLTEYQFPVKTLLLLGYVWCRAETCTRVWVGYMYYSSSKLIIESDLPFVMNNGGQQLFDALDPFRIVVWYTIYTNMYMTGIIKLSISVSLSSLFLS